MGETSQLRRVTQLTGRKSGAKWVNTRVALSLLVVSLNRLLEGRVSKGDAFMTGILQALIVPLVILAALVSVTIALAFYRYFVAKQQDFHIHVASGEVQDVGRQSVVAAKLNWIDRWGKTFTVVTLIYFLILLLLVLYEQWKFSSSGVLVN